MRRETEQRREGTRTMESMKGKGGAWCLRIRLTSLNADEGQERKKDPSRLTLKTSKRIRMRRRGKSVY